MLCLGQTHIDQCYIIKQNNVSLVSEIRDLGILIDAKLTMLQHICALVKKAQMRVSVIFKCFHSRHRATLYTQSIYNLRSATVRICHLSVVTIYAHGYKQNRIGATIIY